MQREKHKKRKSYYTYMVLEDITVSIRMDVVRRVFVEFGEREKCVPDRGDVSRDVSTT